MKAANYLTKPVKKDKLIYEIDNWIESSRMKRQECLLVDNKEGWSHMDLPRAIREF